METIRDLKKNLESNIYRHSRILTLRKYRRQNDLIINALTTTSKKKVFEALAILDNIVNDHGFAINSIKQKKNEKIIKEQQIKDERARIERERRERIRIQNQLEEPIIKAIKSKHGYENIIMTSVGNNGIIGDLSERNASLKVTDLKPIDYKKYKEYLLNVYNNMPDNKKIMLNILSSYGWITYKKKYLTKEELRSYIGYINYCADEDVNDYDDNDDAPEPGMADSLVAIYACSTSYR